jgi:hypothetical protein
MSFGVSDNEPFAKVMNDFARLPIYGRLAT